MRQAQGSSQNARSPMFERRQVWAIASLNPGRPGFRTSGGCVRSVIIVVLVAGLSYLLSASLGLPSIAGIVAAILVLLAGIAAAFYGSQPWF